MNALSPSPSQGFSQDVPLTELLTQIEPTTDELWKKLVCIVHSLGFSPEQELNEAARNTNPTMLAGLEEGLTKLLAVVTLAKGGNNK